MVVEVDAQAIGKEGNAAHTAVTPRNANSNAIVFGAIPNHAPVRRRARRQFRERAAVSPWQCPVATTFRAIPGKDLGNGPSIRAPYRRLPVRAFRNVLLAASVLMVAACRGDVSPPVAPESGGAARTDVTVTGDGSVRVLVALERGVPVSRVVDLVQSTIGGTIYRTYPNIGGFSIEVTEEQRQALSTVPGVVGISDDGLLDIQLDASLSVIGASFTRELGYTGANRIVAVLDNGFDRNHPFIQGRVFAEACFSRPTAGSEQSLCPGEVTEVIGPGAASLNVPACQSGLSNLCEHGQHVAGIVAGGGDPTANAPVSGVAPGAELILVQVFHRDEVDCGPNGTPPCTRAFRADVVAGLDFVAGLAFEQALTGDLRIDAVNLSLGGGTAGGTCNNADPATTNAMALLRSLGVMPVAASGNNSIQNAIGFPACISTVVAVGNTRNDDVINSTSNVGSQLQLFAPGTDIVSSLASNSYGAKSGTSMASPHVAGAFAVLKQRYPSESVDQLLDRMITTGTPISYNKIERPRLNLAAAIGVTPEPPEVTVNAASVTFPEGSLAMNGGSLTDPYGGTATISASRGTIVVTGNSWSWSEPTVDNGPAYTVTLTAKSSLGGSATASFTVSVTNVAPTLTLDPAQVKSGPEFTLIPISASFTDPGTIDTHSATITCYNSATYGTLNQPGTVTSSVVGGVLKGLITSPGCRYGDNGSFTASVTVRDKDGGEDSKSFTVTISNVAPTVTINEDATTVINGKPVLLTSVNAPVDFSGRATDPGSDDLTLLWDWKDGTTRTLTSLSAPPNPDPFPSPSINPRTVIDAFSKTFTAACLREVALSATDDDGGKGSATIAVVIAGNSGRARSSGYWQTQYRNVRNSPVGEPALVCYLTIANHLSIIFSERREANTLAQAGAILQNSGGGGDMSRNLDQQLFAAWINLADGGYRWEQLVDSNGDGSLDVTFGAAMQAAEAVRANASSTRAQLEAQKNIIERLNLAHGG